MKLTKLDKIFSEFIRIRDSHNGIVRCISCGKLVQWKESDAGHFYNRRFMSLRYDEHNVNGQCRSCNRFSEGAIQDYTKGLIKKIGKDSVELLGVKKFNTCKLSQVEVDILTDFYKKKLIELKKAKGI